MKILLAGDSTVASYGPELKPLAGWGEGLEEAIQKSHPEIEVRNFAKAGTSTRSFQEEGYWQQLADEILAGDLIIIQFGHNDQKPVGGVDRNEYYLNLQKMVHDVKEKAGIPILCSPVERRTEENGVFKKNFQLETKLMKKLAKEEDIYLIDLSNYSWFYYQYSSSSEKTKKYFRWLGAGESENYPQGMEDDTHLSLLGAQIMGHYVYQRLRPFLQPNLLFSKYYYGACMYPEVWEEEIVREDIRHMKKIGMNFARIGEFIWSTLEPEEGVYDFTFLEKVLSWYQEADIDVVLCIPTPTPPRWMTEGHSERCIRNIDGTYMEHGSRQHVCTNNDYFRHRAYLLTREIAKLGNRYSNVVGIQLDNEFKCHVDLCYCDTCKERWHQWLEQEYGGITYLNQRWGTKIWSEEYASFSSVPVPISTPFLHNSSLMNAFRLFTAETLNEFAAGLCNMIRMETDIPITHNSAMGFNLLNEELFHELDYVSFDTYASSENHPAFTINLDLWRNMKKGVQEYMLLETSTSHAGHIENYIAPHPAKYLMTEVFTGFASGLKAFTYWHFRGHRFGVEQPHSCVVTAWGEPDSGYEDVVESGVLLEKMRSHLSETKLVPAKIGFLYSDDAKRHYNIETGGVYNYRGLVTEYYGSLVRKGISAEVIQESADFSGFDLLMIPFIRDISKPLLRKCKDFTEKGGTIIFGPMTGDRTADLALPEKNGLGELGNWLHIQKVVQFSARNQACWGTDQQSEELLSQLVTVFEVQSPWETLMKTGAGRVIAAKRKMGNGTVIYLGGLPQDLNHSSLWDRFVCKEILPFDGQREWIINDADVVKYRRDSEEAVQFYLANMTGEKQSYQLMKNAQNLLEGESMKAGEQELQPYTYQILQFSK